MGDMADYLLDVIIDLMANGDETEGMYKDELKELKQPTEQFKNSGLNN